MRAATLIKKVLLLAFVFGRDILSAVKYYIDSGSDIIFYCQFPFHLQWVGSTLTHFGNDQRVVVVSNEHMNLEGIRCYRVSRLGLIFLRSKILVSPATCPGGAVPKSIAPYRVHMPHSLVSFHMIYPKSSFDSYNIIFCCGPYHADEIKSLYPDSASIVVKPVGYGKLDLLMSTLGSSGDYKKTQTPVILIAPSWGDGNIIATMGVSLIEGIIEAGFDVVIRPHALLQDSEEFGAIQRRFKNSARVWFEDARGKGSAIYYADIMISDYSGIAYEYAYLRERPVLFVNVPKKVNNPDWKEISDQPIEIRFREQVGYISQANVQEVVYGLVLLNSKVADYSRSIIKLRDENLYNYGQCGEQAATEINSLLCGLKHG